MILFCKYFLPDYDMSFHFLNSIFCRAEILSLDVVQFIKKNLMDHALISQLRNLYSGSQSSEHQLFLLTEHDSHLRWVTHPFSALVYLSQKWRLK